MFPSVSRLKLAALISWGGSELFWGGMEYFFVFSLLMYKKQKLEIVHVIN